MEEKIDKYVGFRFSEERKRLKFSQKSLSEKLETAQRTISRWEKGDTIPSDKLILSASIGFDVKYVLFGHSKKTEADQGTAGEKPQELDQKLLTEIITAMDEIVAEGNVEPGLSASLKAKVTALLYKNYSKAREKPNRNDPVMRAMIGVLLGLVEE